MATNATIWVVGDSDGRASASTGVWNTVVKDGTNFDLLLYTGDVYEDGYKSDYDALYTRAIKLIPESKIRATPGNHDFAQRSVGYNVFWPSSRGVNGVYYKSDTIGDWKILSVNSQTGTRSRLEPGGVEYEFLKKELSTVNGTQAIVQWHHPRYSADDPNISSGHGDNTFVESIWELCAGKVALIFSGHDHCMQLMKPTRDGDIFDATHTDGTYLVVQGSGGRHQYTVLSPTAYPKLAWGANVFGATRLKIVDNVVTMDFFKSDATIIRTQIVTAKTGTVVVNPPRLQFNTTSVTLPAATEGTTTSVTATVSITNTGGSGDTGFTVSDNQAWLTTSSPGSTAPATLTLTANPTGLTAGSYSAIVTLDPVEPTDTNKTLTVNWTIQPRVVNPPVAPTVSPASGSYATSVSVSMSQSEGAAIRYSIGTGGTVPADPTSGSPLYSAPLSITQNSIIKATAFSSSGQSSVVRRDYTITATPTGPVAPTITPAAGVYQGSVAVAMEQPALVPIYYTVGVGSAIPADPTNASTLYAGPITLTGTSTIKAIAHDGVTASPVVQQTYTVTAVSDLGRIPKKRSGSDVTLTGGGAPVFQFKKPPGTVQGDVMVVTVVGSNHNLVLAGDFTADNGWTVFESASDPRATVNYYVALKLAGANEPESYSLAWVEAPGATSTTGLNNNFAAQGAAYYDVDQHNPWTTPVFKRALNTTQCAMTDTPPEGDTLALFSWGFDPT